MATVPRPVYVLDGRIHDMLTHLQRGWTAVPKKRFRSTLSSPIPGAAALPHGMLDMAWLREEVLAALLPGYATGPLASLLAASARVGLGPVPLFDPAWYRTQNRLPAQADPFTHYMTIGAAQGRDPHPLFSTGHYLAQAPEAGQPGVNPLHHFLTIGGPAGVACHPLFSPDWYRRRYADVGQSGMNPLVHFLRYGRHELRDPAPLFSSAFYTERCATTQPEAADINPLLHYVLHGAAAGLDPSPAFRTSRVLEVFLPGQHPLSAIPHYLETVGAGQAEQAGWLANIRAEPGIVPALPPSIPAPPGQATRDAIQCLHGLGRDGVDAGPEYQLAKLAALHTDPNLPGEFAAAMVAQSTGSGGTPTLLAAIGLLPTQHLPPPGGGGAPHGILDRYSLRRYETAQRFRLNPAGAGTATPGPVISILMPVYRPPLHILERAVLSVLCQTYPNWELCVVDDCSSQPALTAALTRLAGTDPRIKLATTPANAGISAASNQALAMATGAYAGLLDHDDMLTADALEQVAARLTSAPDLVYSDECMLDMDDCPVSLFTKPDWSPLLLTSVMYTGHFSVYRTALVRDAGSFRSQFDFSQDYDLALRVAERSPRVEHVRKVLYGWRMIAGSAAAGGKPDARLTNIAALQSALDRRGWDGTAQALPQANRAVRLLPDPPLVSIIVPSDDAAHILQTVMSLVAHTSYDPYEILVVARPEVIAVCQDRIHGSLVRFIAYSRPFNFSGKCNAGAAQARGVHLVFFNDDVRVLTPDWLQAILECLTLPGVGAVAPKLLYEDHTIQHAGMVTGTRRLVSTAFHAFPARTNAHFNLAQSVREVALLSGACLALPAGLFAELGGFDAINAPIAHSDVDLCLRVREAGYSCVYTPHAELTHIGHASIGSMERAGKPFRQDKADIYLMRRFGPMLEDDPFFPQGMHELLAIGDQVPFRYHAAARTARGLAPRDALLVSHDLSASGAPKVVFDMARALLDAGWHVLVMSPEDGPFRNRLLALGADVMIEPMVLAPTSAVVEMARNFDVVVGNTVLSWKLLPALSAFTRVFLYSHETELAAQLLHNEPGFAPALQHADAVWAGSARAATALLPAGVEARILEYGVEAPARGAVVRAGKEIVVSVLATIEPRKGQDLAVKAYHLLPPELRASVRMRLNGRFHDAGFVAALKPLVAQDPRLTIGPDLSLEEYRDALSEADIVLCPSRDDTLPLVSLNALAEGKVLICSAEVGTSAYIRDGVSGYVLPDNHPAAIAATLTRCIASRRRWPEMGEAARKVFQDHFSQSRFDARLLEFLAPPSQGLRRLADAAE